jgi:DNA repair photolyase
MIMVRLPGNVKAVFEERMRQGFPLTVEKILARTREMHGGKLNDPRFGHRMRGEGEYAAAVERLFAATAERLGLRRRPNHEREAPCATPPASSPAHAGEPSKGRARKAEAAGQLSLFRSR